MDLKQQLDETRLQAMEGMDIPWMLEQAVCRSPDKPCLIWEPFEGDSSTLSYRELQLKARQLGRGLFNLGVREGDFVILHMVNSPEFVISWYACAELGAVAVSTNTRSVARDLKYFSRHTEAVCAITQPSFSELIYNSCDDISLLIVTDNDAGQAAAVSEHVECIPFDEVYDTERTLPALSRNPQRNLSVQFTSGTTSRPKAVLWTHANGVWAGKLSASHLGLRFDDVTLVFMPLFHVNAQGYSMLATHWSGGTMVLQPKFSASRFWPLSLKYKVTWASSIPFVLQALSKHPVPQHSYRFWGPGGNFTEYFPKFNVPMLGWWGMTEILTQGIVADVHHLGPTGTIGRAADEYEIQIRSDDGSLIRPGESGLLFIRGVRGVSMFKEYYKNSKATEDSFDVDGWFETGDIIRMDADGWLFFVNRAKDMLRVGAENVASSEIESVIQSSGLVEECAVVGQPHSMLEEVPVAFVIPLKDTNVYELRSRIISVCSENLADFKVVRDVHVVESLPRSTIEKVAKNALRERLPKIEV